MHAHSKDNREAFGPVRAAIVIAVVGAATLFFTVFAPKNDIQHGDNNMITAAAIGRAGATALPTEPTAQPTRPMQSR
jgi:hypothetical protein